MTSISPAGIIRTDLEGKLTYANRRFGEIIGHKGEVEELFAVFRRLRGDGCEISKFEVRWGLQDKFRWAIGELVPEKIADEVRPSSEIH